MFSALKTFWTNNTVKYVIVSLKCLLSWLYVTVVEYLVVFHEIGWFCDICLVNKDKLKFLLLFKWV